MTGSISNCSTLPHTDSKYGILRRRTQVPGDEAQRGKHMVNEELELFIHGQGAKPRVIVATPGDVLRDVLLRLEVIKEGQDDILVFVGECEEA